MNNDEEKKQNADTQTATENNVQEKQEPKTENKNEGEKTKKQVAQKGENGEIVFKNQDELDGFIRRMYAKGAKEATNNSNNENQDVQKDDQDKSNITNSIPDDYVSTKIALAMAKANVDPKKAERAARLIDSSKILIDGALDNSKLEEEINSVISEFPELKVKKDLEEDNKGFKFGATQGNSNGQEKKKPVSTKKWNRFND